MQRLLCLRYFALAFAFSDWLSQRLSLAINLALIREFLFGAADQTRQAFDPSVSVSTFWQQRWAEYSSTDSGERAKAVFVDHKAKYSTGGPRFVAENRIGQDLISFIRCEYVLGWLVLRPHGTVAYSRLAGIHTSRSVI